MYTRYRKLDRRQIFPYRVCVLGFSIDVKGHYDYGNSYEENI